MSSSDADSLIDPSLLGDQPTVAPGIPQSIHPQGIPLGDGNDNNNNNGNGNGNRGANGGANDSSGIQGDFAGEQEMMETDSERRDRSLAELMLMMEDYRPIIPDEVTAYYLQQAGFDCTDVRVSRLLALSAQKFISDIVSDSFHYARTRTQAANHPSAFGPTPTTAPPTSSTNLQQSSASSGAPGSGGNLNLNNLDGGMQAGVGTGSVNPLGGAGVGGGRGKDRSRTVLTMDDLNMALQEYGINASRSGYYL